MMCLLLSEAIRTFEADLQRNTIIKWGQWILRCLHWLSRSSAWEGSIYRRRSTCRPWFSQRSNQSCQGCCWWRPKRGSCFFLSWWMGDQGVSLRWLRCFSLSQRCLWWRSLSGTIYLGSSFQDADHLRGVVFLSLYDCRWPPTRCCLEYPLKPRRGVPRYHCWWGIWGESRRRGSHEACWL